MIENMVIKSEACFDDVGQSLKEFKKINFLYGPNGSGKTTISRVIGDQEKYAECSVSWQAGNKLQTLVYNRDFINRNFNPDMELKGIFTLGEHDAGVITAIETAKSELGSIVDKISGKKKTLDGEDGNGGKKSELATLEDEFKEQCWALKLKYDDDFKAAFTGVRDTKEKFKARLVMEAEENKADLLLVEQLIEKSKSVFADHLSAEEIIPPILSDDLTALESAAILAKTIIGKDDVDIAAMIKKLGNSDWVRQGRSYFEQNEGYCPFCQQKTEAAFAASLGEYFDEAYLSDVDAIETLATNYDAYAGTILARLDTILQAKPTYLDCEKLESQKDVAEARITANKAHIARKKKEASTVVTLESVKDVLDEINAEITQANTQAKEHNTTIEHLTMAKTRLTSQIWRFVTDEIKSVYDPYAAKRNDLVAAITALESGIASEEKIAATKSVEIENLEKKVTSVQPTIDEINKLLYSFGFSGFSLAQSEKKGFYEIVRPSGESAKETLSEGEGNFITFLYFYHLLKGSNTESGTTTDRVVVFDDPVSSLDSDILFIVSNLIKGVFEEVRSNTGNIKQVFVLTHNIYFHKEISFNKYRSDEIALKDETFRTIKKRDENAVVESHASNPITTSYDLLWSEIRDENRSSLTIQNVMRRIIEHYFKMLGGIDNQDIVNQFEGKEKMICSTIMSWMHDGSHYTNDDLYMTCDDETVDIYMGVFKGIFEKSGHIAHYNMMMGISQEL